MRDWVVLVILLVLFGAVIYTVRRDERNAQECWKRGGQYASVRGYGYQCLEVKLK